MKRMGNRARILAVVVIYFLTCTVLFGIKYVKSSAIWVAHPGNKNVYSNGILKTPGYVVLSDGTTLFSKHLDKTEYASDMTLRKATLHSVGDLHGYINTGVLKSKKTEFMGYDFLNGVYDDSKEGTTITLTLDADTCKAAYNALGSKNGAVGIFNYQTGQILCMVSKPTFDPLNTGNIEKNPDKYEGIYINRLLNGVYTPGSVFKLVTAAAAIENIPDIYEREFQCKGYATINGQKINCSGNHGKINFKKALEHSCNSAFAMISDELGADIIKKYANKYCIGSNEIDGITTAAGLYNATKDDAVGTAWSGIGQHNDLVNPCNFMMFMGAIANGGEVKTPYYIEDISSSFRIRDLFGIKSGNNNIMKSDTAKQLSELMRNNVESYYGDDRFKGMQLCAKTGTAEVSTGAPHSWFAGFCGNTDTPLAFVVVVENGGAGNGAALSVASAALKAAVKTF